MSAILPHMVWPYSANLRCYCRSETWCTWLAENRTQKVAKNRHLGNITQLCRAISLQLRHVSTIDVICNEAVPFRPYCAGAATRTRNVSEYMLVLAPCLVVRCDDDR